MGVIDPNKAPVKAGSIYPEPYAAQMAGRRSLRLGDAAGLSQFGVNLVILEPGAKSSLRHWHAQEDEFVMVTLGELVLVQDAGEAVMRAGDCAGFPAGDPDGHHFINRSDHEAQFLVVGARAAQETVTYSDVDMMIGFDEGRAHIMRRDGSDYPTSAKGETT